MTQEETVTEGNGLAKPNPPSEDPPFEGVDAPLVLRVPETARIPEGATFYDGDDDGKCRLVRADGKRCSSNRQKAYGLCVGHAGSSPLARDPKAYSRLAHAEKERRRERRATLGITARRVGSARQHARMRALERVEAITAALIDAPLDDADLGSIQRQLAVLRMLDTVEPLQTVSLAIEAPSSADDVASMSWQGMQALAASLLAPPEAHLVIEN